MMIRLPTEKIIARQHTEILEKKNLHKNSFKSRKFRHYFLHKKIRIEMT